MVLLRDCLGEVLRAERMERGLTLRELSTRARVSMGYISEVERGHKEASSELLAALCQALGLRLSEVLRQAGETAASTEPVLTPVPLEIASRAELAPVGAERELTSAEVASSEVADPDVVASAA